MSRYRLAPTTAQTVVLRNHCTHARFVWNLAVEQQSHWRPGRTYAPGYLEQCRQLTQARAEHDWLRDGAQMVQQQALRDFSQAMASFFAGTHRRPTWVEKTSTDLARRFDVIRIEDLRVMGMTRSAARHGQCGRRRPGCRYQRNCPESRQERARQSRAQPRDHAVGLGPTALKFPVLCPIAGDSTS